MSDFFSTSTSSLVWLLAACQWFSVQQCFRYLELPCWVENVLSLFPKCELPSAYVFKWLMDAWFSVICCIFCHCCLPTSIFLLLSVISVLKCDYGSNQMKVTPKLHGLLIFCSVKWRHFFTDNAETVKNVLQKRECSTVLTCAAFETISIIDTSKIRIGIDLLHWLLVSSG